MAGTGCIALVSALASAGPVSRQNDLIAVMLIGTVAAIMSVGIAFRWCAVRHFRRQNAASSEDSSATSAAIFDLPMRWLAVRTHNPRAVQHALGMQHPRVCPWSDALSAPFEPRLFISPPVKGWVLVMGCDLPDPAADIDQCFHFLTRLSRQLGDVQFFARNRAVAHHGWARLDSGKVLRAYFWAGETLWNQGLETRAERDLKLHCLSYGESGDSFGLKEREVMALNTEKVARLAGAWSLDPSAVGPDQLETNGIAGDLLHWKLH